MNRDVHVLAARRTPIGRRNGSLAAWEAPEIASAVFSALAPAGLRSRVGRVILANTTNAGNVARVAALAAGLPASTPAVTVNAQCCGGLTAVRMGAEAIASGTVDLVLAGGCESVSHTLVSLGPGIKSASHLPRVRHGGGTFGDPDMGAATDALATRLGITRAAQDAYAAGSYERTLAAREAGFFAPLIAPCCGVNTDDQSRRAPGPGRLARYPSAFTDGGPGTAGNSAAPADGAAAVLLASAAAAHALGIEPLARIVAATDAAADPAAPPLGAVAAIERVLARAGLAADGIGRWEVNEAFAAKILACMEAVGIAHERVNPRGGAIAYGHPFAASGAVLVVHLLAEMQAAGVPLGLAALAGAGGLGEAMVFARD